MYVVAHSQSFAPPVYVGPSLAMGVAPSPGWWDGLSSTAKVGVVGVGALLATALCVAIRGASSGAKYKANANVGWTRDWPDDEFEEGQEAPETSHRDTRRHRREMTRGFAFKKKRRGRPSPRAGTHVYSRVASMRRGLPPRAQFRVVGREGDKFRVAVGQRVRTVDSFGKMRISDWKIMPEYGSTLYTKRELRKDFIW